MIVISVETESAMFHVLGMDLLLASTENLLHVVHIPTAEED